jgi:hypothetical protein
LRDSSLDQAPTRSARTAGAIFGARFGQNIHSP